MTDSKDNYLILYEFAKGRPPYQPTSSWSIDASYKPDKFFLLKDKTKFVPDEFLLTKKEFIRDKF